MRQGRRCGRSPSGGELAPVDRSGPLGICVGDGPTAHACYAHKVTACRKPRGQLGEPASLVDIEDDQQ